MQIKEAPLMLNQVFIASFTQNSDPSSSLLLNSFTIIILLVSIKLPHTPHFSTFVSANIFFHHKSQQCLGNFLPQFNFPHFFSFTALLFFLQCVAFYESNGLSIYWFVFVVTKTEKKKKYNLIWRAIWMRILEEWRRSTPRRRCSGDGGVFVV